MTWSVIGHGSFFAGASDPGDIDVMVVTDEDIDAATAARCFAPMLEEAGPRLPLDVHVVRPDRLGTIERALMQIGVLLDGDDLRDVTPVVTWPEWAGFMAAAAAQFAAEAAPARAALAAGLAIVAPVAGVVSRCEVPDAAHGTRWAELTAAAWRHRRDPRPFTHPDLDDALAGAVLAARGEITPASVTYRAALPVALRSSAVAEGLTCWNGGWLKAAAVAQAHQAHALWTIGQLANASAWHRELLGHEIVEVHRHPPGTTFPLHVDRQERVSPALAAAYPDGDLELLKTRSHNVVGMIQPAEAGGKLLLHPPGHATEAPTLEPGDVIVFDGTMPHEVTAVERGERVVIVTHLHA